MSSSKMVISDFKDINIKLPDGREQPFVEITIPGQMAPEEAVNTVAYCIWFFIPVRPFNKPILLAPKENSQISLASILAITIWLKKNGAEYDQAIAVLDPAQSSGDIRKYVIVETTNRDIPLYEVIAVKGDTGEIIS